MKTIYHFILSVALFGVHFLGFCQIEGFKSDLFIVEKSTGSTALIDSAIVSNSTIKDSEATTIIDSASSDTIIKKVTLPLITKPDTIIQEKKEEQKETPISQINEIISFGKIFWSIIIIVIGFFTINFLIKIVDSLAEKNTEYRFTFKGLIPIIKIIGWALVTITVIAGVIQPPFETVIAVTASVGIAIGFAAQDILKNIFGGIMIVFDRPFQVGDKIEIGNYYGEVVEIGLRSTRIVTKDDSLVSVPNSEAVNNAVSNSNTGESNCQVVAEIWLPIDLNTAKARAIAIESAQVSPYVYLNKPIVVLFINEVKERRSYLKMRVKAYVSDTRNEFIFMSDVTERVVKELLRQGIITKEDLY